MDKALFQTYQSYLKWERLATEWEALKNSSDPRLADLQEEVFEGLNVPLEAPLGEETSLMDAYLKEGSSEDPSEQLEALIAFGREQTEARLRRELNLRLEGETQDLRTARYFMEETGEVQSVLTGEMKRAYNSKDFALPEAARELTEMKEELEQGNLLGTAQHYLFGKNNLAAAAVYADGGKAFKVLETQEKIKGLGIVIAAAAVSHAAVGAAILAGALPEAAATFVAPLGFTGATRAFHGRLWNPDLSTAGNIADWVVDYTLTASMFKYLGVVTRGLAGESGGALVRYAAESAGFATYTPMENIVHQAIAGHGFDEQLFLDQTASPQALLDQQLMLLGLKAGGYPLRLTMRPLDRAVQNEVFRQHWQRYLDALAKSGEDVSDLRGLKLAPIGGGSGRPPAPSARVLLPRTQVWFERLRGKLKEVEKEALAEAEALEEGMGENAALRARVASTHRAAAVQKFLLLNSNGPTVGEIVMALQAHPGDPVPFLVLAALTAQGNSLAGQVLLGQARRGNAEAARALDTIDFTQTEEMVTERLLRDPRMVELLFAMTAWGHTKSFFLILELTDRHPETKHLKEEFQSLPVDRLRQRLEKEGDAEIGRLLYMLWDFFGNEGARDVMAQADLTVFLRKYDPVISQDVLDSFVEEENLSVTRYVLDAVREGRKLPAGLPPPIGGSSGRPPGATLHDRLVDELWEISKGQEELRMAFAQAVGQEPTPVDPTRYKKIARAVFMTAAKENLPPETAQRLLDWLEEGSRERETDLMDAIAVDTGFLRAYEGIKGLAQATASVNAGTKPSQGNVRQSAQELLQRFAPSGSDLHQHLLGQRQGEFRNHPLAKTPDIHLSFMIDQALRNMIPPARSRGQRGERAKVELAEMILLARAALVAGYEVRTKFLADAEKLAGDKISLDWTLSGTEAPLTAGPIRTIAEVEGLYRIDLSISGDGGRPLNGIMEAEVIAGGGRSGRIKIVVGRGGKIELVDNINVRPFQTDGKTHLSAEEILKAVRAWGEAYNQKRNTEPWPPDFFKSLLEGVRHPELKRLMDKQREWLEGDELSVEQWVVLFEDVFGQLYNAAEGAAEGEGATWPLEAFAELVTIMLKAEKNGVHFPKLDRLREQALALAARAPQPESSTRDLEGVPRDPESGMAEIRQPRFLDGPADRAAQQLNSDIKTFGTPPDLTRKIEGLTPELQEKFLDGDRVVPWPDGGYLLVHLPSGADTINAERASEADYQAYLQWKAVLGFEGDPVLRSGQPAPAQTRLIEFGREHRLDIKIGDRWNDFVLGEHHARYLAAVLKMLPPGLLKNSYLKGIIVGASRNGAAMGSAFAEGYVHLYHGALVGPRQRLLALLLHEIGHSTAERYALSTRENKVGTSAWVRPIPPDASISLAIRQKMHDGLRKITRARELFAVDWPGGTGRRDYISMDFAETMAEHHLLYVAAGETLRSHIRQIGDPAIREAYQFVYDELKTRIFVGKEYGTRNEGGTEAGSADPLHLLGALWQGAKGLLGIKPKSQEPPRWDIAALVRRLEKVDPELKARRGIGWGSFPAAEKIKEAEFLGLLEMELTDTSGAIQLEGADIWAKQMDWPRVTSKTRQRAQVVWNMVQMALTAGKDVREGKPGVADDYQLVKECVEKFPPPKQEEAAPIPNGNGNRSVKGEIKDPEIPPPPKLSAPPGADYRSPVLPQMEVITLGRDPNSIVPLSGERVSRRHARIFLNAKKQWVIEDSESKNGTFVNDKRIKGPTVLKPGDVIRIGPYEWTVGNGRDNEVGSAESHRFKPQGPTARPAPTPSPSLADTPRIEPATLKVLGNPPQGTFENPIVRLEATDRLGEAAATSDPGRGGEEKGKPNNEDGVVLVKDPSGNLHLAVFDGMGGHDNADIATQLGSEAFARSAAAGGSAKEGLLDADRQIRGYNEAQSVLKGHQVKTGAVAAAAMITPESVLNAHWAGDARIVVSRPGEDGRYHLIFRTLDETEDALAVQEGDLALTQAVIEETGYSVSGSLGRVVAELMHLRETRQGLVPDDSAAGFRFAEELENGMLLQKGDIVIGGSDGLWGNLPQNKGRLEAELNDILGASPGADKKVVSLRGEIHHRMEIYRQGYLAIKKEAAAARLDDSLYRAPITYKGSSTYLRAQARLFIDKYGDIWDAPTRGEKIDSFALDHFSVFVYEHRPLAASGRVDPSALPERARGLSRPADIVRFFMEEASRQDGEDPEAREYAWVVRYDDAGHEMDQFVVVGERDRVSVSRHEKRFIMAHNHTVFAGNRGVSLAPAEQDIHALSVDIIDFLERQWEADRIPDSIFRRDGKFYNYIFSEEGVCVIEIDLRPSSPMMKVYFSIRPSSTGDPTGTKEKIMENLSKESARGPEVFRDKVIEVPWGEISNHPAFTALVF